MGSAFHYWLRKNEFINVAPETILKHSINRLFFFANAYLYGRAELATHNELINDSAAFEHDIISKLEFYLVAEPRMRCYIYI